MMTRLEKLGLDALFFNAALYAFSPLVCGTAAFYRGGSFAALFVFGVAAGAALVAVWRHAPPAESFRPVVFRAVGA